MLGKDLEVNTIVLLDRPVYAYTFRKKVTACNNLIYIYAKEVYNGAVTYSVNFLWIEPNLKNTALVYWTILNSDLDANVINIYSIDDFYFYKDHQDNIYKILDCDINKDEYYRTLITLIKIKDINTDKIVKCDVWLNGGSDIAPAYNRFNNNLIKDIYDSLGE